MDENSAIMAMICKRIKMTRIEKNLSQVELAERSKVGIATIKRIETGESITLLTLISVLRGLDEIDQLNNLLAYSEINSKKNEHQKRKRKVPTNLNDSTQDSDKKEVNNDFIESHINNMHWKY